MDITLECYAEMMPILCVEAVAVNKVDATPYNISSSECWSICLACPRATEAVTIISMVAIGVLVPPWQPVHVDPLGRQPHTHVPVPPLGYDLHLKIVETTRCRYRVGGSHTARILVILPMTFIMNTQI